MVAKSGIWRLAARSSIDKVWVDMSNYTPRLKVKYNEEVLPVLMKKFAYSSKMQVPVLKKITLNMGLGKAKEEPWFSLER